MENSGDGKGTFTLKHYLFLLIWWLSLGFTLDTNSALLGLVLSFVFFTMTAKLYEDVFLRTPNPLFHIQGHNSIY